jgi:hypothetical protein
LGYKQKAPPAYSQRSGVVLPGEQAVAAEAWRDLVLLEEDARRQHIHWVHVRTKKTADRQPESFTRAGFFDHLCKCYQEAYPERANKHGSYLLFGAVAKEAHKTAADDGGRYEHHHAPVFTSKRHMWKPVADISYRKYHVKLTQRPMLAMLCR